MTSLLNKKRPPMFCPGCSHEYITKAIDKAFVSVLGLKGEDIAIVTDIGCSGLFDTFFSTHAMHGLHGRALTYATGIKMANPNINVITTMGDGGLGIGGAHFLAACRRNLNLTLIILNNFNFGMTGGQFSPTTSCDAEVNSGFLNKLEKPIDICKIAKAAGAPYVVRCSSYDKTLSEKIAAAIDYNGMSVLDIQGVCPGRYSKKNKINPKIIDNNISKLPPEKGEVPENVRKEYGITYRETINKIETEFLPNSINVEFNTLETGRHEIMILGSAGQRVVTAGELLCLAGLSSGFFASQKNDYPITVLRGHSVSDLILSTKEIGYAGIDNPNIVIAISEDGIKRRSNVIKKLSSNALIIADAGLKIPKCKATIKTIEFKENRIKFQDRALACLTIMASMNKVINIKMLKRAIKTRFKEGSNLEKTLKLINKIKKINLKDSYDL